MAERTKGGSTPATKALSAAGVEFTQRTYGHDPSATSYGREAAEVLGVEPTRVLKTLLAQTDLARDHGLVVAVVPVDGQLDLKALASAVGARRARMADPAVAERTTGYVVGGISPIGGRRCLPTVVDESAMEHGTVLVSGGRRGLELEMAPGDLVSVSGAVVASIAKGA